MKSAIKDAVDAVKEQDQGVKEQDKGIIAVIRLRGSVRESPDVSMTMNMLHLYRRNYCSVVPKTSSAMGMLARVKDFVTFGEIDESTYKLLIQKRGEEYKSYKEKKNIIKIGNKSYKPYFRLHPPIGGFERKGIKASFVQGGSLGNRKEKIADLIKRMI